MWPGSEHGTENCTQPYRMYFWHNGKFCQKKKGLKLEKTPTLIYACFILHNFCELYNIYTDEESV